MHTRLLSILMLEVWLSEYLPRARAAQPSVSSLCRMSSALSYAVVTPVRNEADNILRLAEALARQSRLPTSWIIVDTGSTDQTPVIVDDLARAHSWIETRSLDRRPSSFVADQSRGRSSSALQPPLIRRTRREARRGHVVCTGLLRTAAGGIRCGSCARHGQRDLRGARGRRVARASRNGDDRMGSVARLQTPVPCGCPAARAPDGLGRRGRVPGELPRLEDTYVQGAPFPPPPPRGRT